MIQAYDMPDHISTLIDLLNSEEDRFWIRFNIFFAIQVVAVFSIIKNARTLVENTIILKVALAAMITFSLLGAVVTTRSWDMQNSVIESIRSFENAHVDPKYRIVETVTQNTVLPNGTNDFACIMFAWTCVLFWIAAWIWLVSKKGYEKVALPKSPES